MKNKYKIPWHVRQYVKKELMDYKKNKKLVANYKGDTRGLILATTRLNQIENVLSSLNKEDREAAEELFFGPLPFLGVVFFAGVALVLFAPVPVFFFAPAVVFFLGGLRGESEPLDDE